MNRQDRAPATKSAVVIERTYFAPVEDLWDLWTTKEGFESWWCPEGCRTQVHTIDARVGGALHYDMIAVEPAQIADLKRMGGGPSHAVHARFTEVEPKRRLSVTHIVDFRPGLQPDECTIAVDFIPIGESVRMVVTIQPMREEELMQKSVAGFISQLRRLEGRFLEGRFAE
jgi:uncharacterized protein YndB with AHSA1/START domain